MQASTCNERLPLSVQIARHASRFVTIWRRGLRHPQLFSSSVVGLAVEFPLYQLGHVAKPSEIARAAEFVADKKKQKKRKEQQ
jgi:hypothetical protein